MKKLGLILCLMLLVCSLAYGAPEGKVETIFNDTAVATTNTSTSRAIICKSGGYFGAWIKASVGIGAPDINIVYQMSPDNVYWATPVTATPVVSSLITTDGTIVSINPTPMKYIRFVAYGNTANTTGTTIMMKLFTQE